MAGLRDPARRMWSGTRRAYSAAGSLFHKANSPALFHSIESVDNLISVEDRDEPVHCTRSVSWAGRNVFSEDAPGIFDGLQYVVLIRGVHSPHPLSADSIRSLSDSFRPMPLVPSMEQFPYELGFDHRSFTIPDLYGH